METTASHDHNNNDKNWAGTPVECILYTKFECLMSTRTTTTTQKMYNFQCTTTHHISRQ